MTVAAARFAATSLTISRPQDWLTVTKTPLMSKVAISPWRGLLAFLPVLDADAFK